MWNSFDTKGQLGLTAEIIPWQGGNGDEINAWVARPTSSESRGGVVIAHHMPGWDEFTFEMAERIARHGYDVICPNLYYRYSGGTPDEAWAATKAAGGPLDDVVVADLEAAQKWLKALPTSNGKVAVIGTCSGGRHAVLAASRVEGFDAVVDLWGGGVVADPADATPARPVAPIEYTADLSAPLLGIFGNDDRSPTAEQVDIHEAELKKHGKDYAFHRYDGAGHAIFYYQTPLYRPEAAMDGWEKMLTFFGEQLRT